MNPQDVIEDLCARAPVRRIIARLQRQVGPAIDSYTRRVSTRTPSRSPKAIKDSVWGMIDLSGPEVAIVDSPPLQRLRQIRQLGLSYLTYPTATHSRFEHTLGVMYQAERMLRAIAKRSAPAEANVILNYVKVVRLAAMLHDIGHMPLSHVSERYFQKNECEDPPMARRIENFCNACREALLTPKISLSECLAIALISTPSFKTLLTTQTITDYTDEEVCIAQVLIGGRPPSPETAYLAQVLSNVIDADKLDYLFRDAFMTGLPLPVDLDRLLYKVQCFSVPVNDCPSAMRRLFQPAHGAVRILGTDLSGEKHARDVLMSRMLLHERIYRHHKTVAAERVAFKTLANLRMSPEELLAKDDALVIEHTKPGTARRNRDPILASRNLPKRAFAISYGFLGSAEPEWLRGKLSPWQERAWSRLNEILEDPAKRNAVANNIQNKFRQIRRLLKKSACSPSVWLGPIRPIESPTLNFDVRAPDGTIVEDRFRLQAAMFPQLAYAIEHCFVSNLTDADLPELFIAIETTIAETTGLRLGRQAADYAKISWARVESIKRRLQQEKESLFSKTWFLRPSSEYLTTVECTDRLITLSNKFCHFNVGDYSISDSKYNYTITVECITRFLQQFPDQLIRPMVQLLENVDFMDRSDLGREFAASISDASESGYTCVPLSEGQSKSATHLAYYFKDGQENTPTRTLREALMTDSAITFYEDCTLSGKQPRTTIQKWFGLKTDLEEEELAEPLTEDERTRLRNRNVRFRFAFATSEGIQTVRELTKSVGLGNDVEALRIWKKKKSPLFEYLKKGDADRLKEFLSEVGYNLLTSTKHREKPEKWTERLCRERAFGYGGRGLLTVMCYNCPTSSITALWKVGEFRGGVWWPLFPRRNELDNVERILLA